MTAELNPRTSPRYPADFYGFPAIPFHVHLGMTFERPDPDGPAVLTVPARPEIVDAHGLQSPAAVYTVAEVSCGVAAADALLLHQTMGGSETTALVLTRRIKFWRKGPARGAIHSDTWVAGDADAALERLLRVRKVDVETWSHVYDEHGALACEMQAFFYARLMHRDRLRAMAGPLLASMDGGAS